MKIHCFHAQPSPDLAEKLRVFERQFQYPLGEHQSFRVSHGEDYTRFYRAIGEATCFAAEHRGEVVGVLSTAIRQLLFPQGNREEVVYVGDLKVVPSNVSGFALFQLMATTWEFHKRNQGMGFGVMMDGTKIEPDRYTGRLGLPKFVTLGKVMILRIPVHPSTDADPEVQIESCGEARQNLFQELSVRRFGTVGGDTELRSRFEPVALRLAHPAAYGLLEDTLKAKQLNSTDGTELLSSHVSKFAFSIPAAGARLIRTALSITRDRGLPALFTAVPTSDADHLMQELQMKDITLAPATIFGTGLDSGFLWNVNTSEI